MSRLELVLWGWNMLGMRQVVSLVDMTWSRSCEKLGGQYCARTGLGLLDQIIVGRLEGSRTTVLLSASL